MADSLIVQYNAGKYSDELDILTEIAIEETNPDRKLEFSELLIKRASIDSSFNFLYNGYLQKGYALQFKGQNAEALESFFKSLEFATRTGNEEGVGSLMISIADTYTVMGNSRNSQKYYNRGIQLLRKLNDSLKIATALLNAGDDFINAGKLDSALIYTKEAALIFNRIHSSIGQAYGLGNMGMVYAKQGNDDLAETNIKAALIILEELKDYYPIAVYLTYMADIYANKLDYNTAFGYLERSLELAQSYGLKDQISDANLKLSELYERFGDYKASHHYYKQHIAYRDSIKNIEAVQKMADQRTDYEVSQKQVEVDLLNQQKRNQRIVLGFSGLLLFTLFWYYRSISKEKKKSETLLLNILPAETAKELKDKGMVKAKKIESATVLFTDFKDFTSYSEMLTPEALVETVGFYFSKFDEIMEKHGIEKIKTIGDSYMCAGGLNAGTSDHTLNTVLAAKEIVQFVEETKADATTTNMHFDVRVGINVGPVVAGVVGSKKFAYDIWGDTVNVASRMESNSEAGKINISEATYEQIKDEFDCEYRGEIEAKNKGKIKMYFVTAAKKSGNDKALNGTSNLSL
ncbi:MAG: adenylate/guanylate cyclase domain-containing protein [Flavobacteriaceae bacterium]